MRSTGGELFQALEARVVLSSEYYSMEPLDEIAGFDGDWISPTGVSRDGEYIWGWDHPGGEFEDLREWFIATRERVWTDADLPLLADAAVDWISNEGMILATDIEGDDIGREFLLDIHDPTARHYLDEQITSVPPEFEFASLEGVTIGENGDLFVTTKLTDSTAVWLVRGGTAMRLWDGPRADTLGEPLEQVSSTSIAVGHAIIAGQITPILWTETGGLVPLAGLARVGGVNAAGLIAGSTNEGVIAFWLDGALQGTDLFNEFGGVGKSSYSYTHHVQQVDNQGRAIVRRNIAAANSFSSDTWIVEDGSSFLAADHVFGSWGGDEFRNQRVAAGESGQLAVDGAFLDTIPFDVLLPGISGYPVALGAREGSVAAVTLAYGGSTLILRAGTSGIERWEIDRQSGTIWNEPDLQYATYTDPRSGGVILVLNDPSAHQHAYALKFIPLDESRGSTTGRGHANMHALRRGVTAFVSNDRRAHIAGLGEEGDFVLLFEQHNDQGWEWVSNNLSKTHLEPQGKQTPDFTGQLASFSTAWGAMNIVGLDGAGDVHALWWTPGRLGLGWTASNISAAAGAPKLVGSITATATPWGAMQIFGTDARGHLIGLWWAPNAGGWHTTDLTALTGGLTLDHCALTVQSMPWAGLSLVGKTADGEVAAYWWTPETGWASDRLADSIGDPLPLIAGPVSYEITRAGSQHIAAVDEAGHVMHLFWQPDGQGWRVQDLTQLAIG